ncbi:TetR/AcrR family transcriptional regulator [Streptomyces sp. NPDC087844]|uniref:TetR/AcrR family transcriptional regulator n=1 Tax=Streptomyces sp. NPDC087844 TaxID=3365805 RepID=UPI0037F37E68
MARTKGFDPDAALSHAVELFWRRGYEGTSISDLVAHLGVGRPSIYATFGSKHELYVKSLEKYAEARVAADLEQLSRPGAVMPTVRAWIRRYVDEVNGDEMRLGCFVVNAAAELMPDDHEVARVVEGAWGATEAALTVALLRAHAQGELPEGRELRALARCLMALLHGIRVFGKRRSDRGYLDDVVSQAFLLLG